MASIEDLQGLDFTDWFNDASTEPLQMLKPDMPSSEPATKKSKGKVDKKQLNKEAADRYRRKRREQFEFLESQTSELSSENVELKAKCDKLESEVTYLKDLLMATVKASSNPLAALSQSTFEKPSAAAASVSLDTAIADPSLPSGVGQLVKVMVEHRRAVTEARFVALEEKITMLTQKVSTKQ